MSQETRNAIYGFGTALLAVLATAGFITTNLVEGLTGLLGAGLTLLAAVHSTKQFEVRRNSKDGVQ